MLIIIPGVIATDIMCLPMNQYKQIEPWLDEIHGFGTSGAPRSGESREISSLIARIAVCKALIAPLSKNRIAKYARFPAALPAFA